MDDTNINSFIGILSYLIKTMVTNPGPSGVICILILLIGYFIWDKRNMVKRIEAMDDRNDKIISSYYDIVFQVTNTLGGIKQVLQQIRDKM